MCLDPSYLPPRVQWFPDFTRIVRAEHGQGRNAGHVDFIRADGLSGFTVDSALTDEQALKWAAVYEIGVQAGREEKAREIRAVLALTESKALEVRA